MTQTIRWLQDEIADRMLQKLDIVKIDVKDILVVPDFPGKHLNILAKRFPRAGILSLVDSGVSSFAMWHAKAMCDWRSIFGSRNTALADYTSTGKFDLPDNSVDLVFSDLLLQDLVDPKQFLQECWRVLRDGGLISFSYLGPDTGRELCSLAIPELKLKNLLSPWDMHDMGDALLSGRFSDPVMDMEYLTLDYENSSLFLADIEAIKLIDPHSHETQKNGVFPQKLTLEIVYGHAWVIGKHLAKTKDGVAYIDLNQIRHKTRLDSS